MTDLTVFSVQMGYIVPWISESLLKISVSDRQLVIISFSNVFLMLSVIPCITLYEVCFCRPVCLSQVLLSFYTAALCCFCANKLHYISENV